MPDTPKISDRQLALLCDLAALADAGLINQGGDILVESGQWRGSLGVETPGVLTHKGLKLVADFKQSGRTIFP